MSDFESADLYHYRDDDEEIPYSTASDAIDGWFRNVYDDDNTEMTVFAFCRRKPHPGDIHNVAERVAGYANDCLGDDCELAGPDHPVLDVAAILHLERAIEAQLHRVIREHGFIWACEEVASQAFTIEQAMEIAGRKEVEQ